MVIFLSSVHSLSCFVILLTIYLNSAKEISKKQEEQTKTAIHEEFNSTLSKNQERKRGNYGNAVKVTVYFGSRCDESSYFIETQLEPVWKALSKFNRIDLELIPFGRGECVPHKQDYMCICQHGPEECDLNQLMSCTMKYISNPKKYMPIIFCIQGKVDLEDADDECLAKMVNNSQRKQLMKCASSVEGRKLMKALQDKTKRVKPTIEFFPWVTVDSESSISTIRILLRVICQKLDPLPEICDSKQGFWDE